MMVSVIKQVLSVLYAACSDLTHVADRLPGELQLPDFVGPSQPLEACAGN